VAGLIVAVTGGTGFVGRALLARLARDPSVGEIRLLSRKPPVALASKLRTVNGDLAGGPADLAGLVAGADVLFHCAGELRQESAMRALHVDGTQRLIDAASGRVRRWIQLSSVGVYGRGVREATVEEAAAPRPEGEYESTKAESDRLAARAAARAAFELVVLRPSIVFGPAMPNRSLYQLVSAIDRGWMIQVGSAAIANYVYVDDVADALATCAFTPGASGIYILSDDRPMPAFLAAIAAELGRSHAGLRLPERPLRWVAGTFGKLPGFPLTESRLDALTRRVRYPSRRLLQELGYRFAVSIENGLRRLVQDWRTRR